MWCVYSKHPPWKDGYFKYTHYILLNRSKRNIWGKYSQKKNWRPPRLRAFGSGGRKRNTYEYACLLTRPDCCRNRKKVCQNSNEWIVIAIILIMYSSSTLIRSLVFLKLKKNYPKNISLSHEEPMTLSNLIFRKLKGFQSSGVFVDWIWKKKSPKRTEFSSSYQ